MDETNSQTGFWENPQFQTQTFSLLILLLPHTTALRFHRILWYEVRVALAKPVLGTVLSSRRGSLLAFTKFKK